MVGLKTCSKCGEGKLLDEFYKAKQAPDGRQRWCKECSRASFKRWCENNPERVKELLRDWKANNPDRCREHDAKKRRRFKDEISARNRRWRAANRDRVKANQKRWAQANQSAVREANRRWYEKNFEQVKMRNTRWWEEHPEFRREFRARRRAAERQQTPPWLTNEHIAELRALYAHSSKDFHVDHIWPLRGKDAWGLHVPWNLQVLPAEENMRKHTKTPQEHSHDKHRDDAGCDRPGRNQR